MLSRVALALLVVLPCTTASAESLAGLPADSDERAVAPGGPNESWGTTATTVARVMAFECTTFSPTSTWRAILGTPGRYLDAGGAFECAFNVPTGAAITRIEMEASDTTSAGQVTAVLYAVATAGGAVTIFGPVATGDTATPDWAVFGYDLPTPLTVDNRGYNYFLEVMNTTSDGKTWFASLRVYYKLQVSPGPATATFTDVPISSPYFRYVEALVAAGITGGCGTGIYCPNGTVTRGQMAVFLASALGMHWAN